MYKTPVCHLISLYEQITHSKYVPGLQINDKLSVFLSIFDYHSTTTIYNFNYHIQIVFNIHRDPQ